jgi:hypothetical protein
MSKKQEDISTEKFSETRKPSKTYSPKAPDWGMLAELGNRETSISVHGQLFS